MKDRKEIDIKYTWDLKKIYNNIEDFEKDYKKAKEKISKLKEYEGKCTENAKLMYESIDSCFNTARIIEKLYTYTNLSFDLDTLNNEKQALNEKVANLLNYYYKTTYYFYPSIIKIDEEVLNKYYEEEPKLKEYKNYIKDIYRYKNHVLSDEEERLLSKIGKIVGNAGDTYSLLCDADMSFGNIHDEEGNIVELTISNYASFMESKKREVRRDAFNTLYKEYKKYSNTFASLLATNMKEDSVFSEINKFNSSLERSLFADEVEVDVYNNLIDSVHNNIAYLHDYYKLKKELLKLDELHIYDTGVSIIDNYDKNYTFEEAKDKILDVLKIFGDEYINKVKEYLDNRIIDVYATKGKRTGGYSSGCYDTEPYILLNYMDKFDDISTLIHEMGHSMHSYYSRKYNSYQDSEYRIFVAEVASTVNQLLLSYYMIEHSDSKEEKLYILNNLMELYKSTIYRQTMFAEFEKTVHELSDDEEAMTSNKLCDIYYDLNKEYFGDSVVIDDEIRYEWERIPHFYYNFYVYKYATGLSAASSIVKGILEGKENAIDNYIKFLKCGGSLSPLESLKVAGIDLTDSKVIDDALMEFNRAINMFKDLVKRDK